MTSRFQLARGLAWLVPVAVLAGCPSHSSAPASAGHAGHAGSGAGTAASDAGPSDAGGGDSSAGDAAMVACPNTAVLPEMFHIDTMLLGDMKKINAKLVDAMPAPPARYNNTWMVQFVDASGNPLDDVTLTKAQAAMPYHGHPPKLATMITKMGEPGEFAVGVFLTMPGYFQISFDVSSPTAGDDHVMFEYCLPQ